MASQKPDEGDARAAWMELHDLLYALRQFMEFHQMVIDELGYVPPRNPARLNALCFYSDGLIDSLCQRLQEAESVHLHELYKATRQSEEIEKSTTTTES